MERRASNDSEKNSARYKWFNAAKSKTGLRSL